MLDAHVHLERGPYTLEWIGEFVRQAQRVGVDQLYLLEHSHRFREFAAIYRRRVDRADPGFGAYQRAWLERKMTVSLAEYVRLAEAVRNADFPIAVRCGLEVCYFPGETEAIRAVVAGYDWDFLTGSVHWIDGWGFDHPATQATWLTQDVDAVYRRYYQIMEELIGSGLFSHLGHPDSLKCFGHYPQTDLTGTYRAIARLAQAHRLKVEFNAGLRLNYGHPELGLSPAFLAQLQAAGAELVTASDAHRPEDVGRYLREAEAMIRDSGPIKSSRR